ncbi:anti sigma factor C-terminal domain-containing protein, partial [Enterococcus faecalis]|nr:anti sigma factor C-terminal domain-containing protein [Enterococcus faecalis]
TNQKIPQFYNTHAQKQSEGEVIATPTQELPLVKNMENQLVEVAITFDKPYTLGDINSMIPSNLKTNWYWIGTTSKGNSSTWSMYSLYGTDAQGFTREEYVDEQAAQNALKESAKQGGQPDQQAMATKAVDAFLTNLKAVLDAPGDATYNDTRPRDDIEKYLEKFGHLDLTKEEDRNKLEFSGIILTGRAEDFAQLENADWIYASSIGASIPNQPYYTLSQE